MQGSASGYVVRRGEEWEVGALMTVMVTGAARIQKFIAFTSVASG